MGLFGTTRARIKKASRVGATNDKDLGSLSGMEIQIHANNEMKLFRPKAVSGLETDKPVKKKPTQKQKSKKFCSFRYHHKRKDTPRTVEEPYSPILSDTGSSGSSNDLSVYTTSKTTIEDNPKQRAIIPDDHAKSRTRHENGYVTLKHVPDLILDLETAVLTSAKRPVQALKMLLSLSNKAYQSVHETRVQMVRADSGRLVPALLRFLNRCMVQTKEYNQVLLLLSNLSIPNENKKIIALDHKGVEILSRLLCEDPSSYIVALVLVNLTCDTCVDSHNTSIEVMAGARINGSKRQSSTIEVIQHNHNDGERKTLDRSSLRKELLDTNDSTALVESLAFALRVASLTPQEYEARRETIENCNFSEKYLSHATRLSILMAKDQQLRSFEDEATPIPLRRQRVLPATASTHQILRQLRSNEQELDRWGSIEGNYVGENHRHIGMLRGETSSVLPLQHRTYGQLYPPPMVEPSRQSYPETAKWCLSALRNLTKPCNRNATAAHAMIKSGIFSLIVQYITILGASDSHLSRESRPMIARRTTAPTKESSLLFLPRRTSNRKICSQSRIVPRVHGKCDITRCESEQQPLELPLLPYINSPYSWESNSMQDAALSIVLNLAASPASREYINEPHIIKVLTMIAQYPRLFLRKKIASAISQSNRETMNFQALKARMAISYLIGSQGHFGQSKLRSSASTVEANRTDSPLVMSNADVELLVELLANTMNLRGKADSYLPGTFDLECIIFSLRCLLTHTANQEQITRLVGPELNALFINTLARYSLEPSSSPIDSLSASHIVFSLYLLSNHGFEGLPFLPEMYRKQRSRLQPTKTESIDDEDHGLAANILVSYLRLSDVPPDGRHAANQLLLRLEYLNFESDTSNSRIARRRTLRNAVRLADLKINYILLAEIRRVKIPNRKHGEKPDRSIFNGKVLRCLKPCNWGEGCHNSSSSNPTKGQQKKIEWNNRSGVSSFANALIAVQQLSYGSIKVRRSRSDLIDDIAIANTIAHCAGNKAYEGCYNFLWAWEGAKFGDIDQHEGMSSSLSQRLKDSSPFRSHTRGDNTALTIPSFSNSIASNDSNSVCEAKSEGSCEAFSFLRLCCSSDSTES